MNLQYKRAAYSSPEGGTMAYMFTHGLSDMWGGGGVEGGAGWE